MVKIRKEFKLRTVLDAWSNFGGDAQTIVHVVD